MLSALQMDFWVSTTPIQKMYQQEFSPSGNLITKLNSMGSSKYSLWLKETIASSRFPDSKRDPASTSCSGRRKRMQPQEHMSFQVWLPAFYYRCGEFGYPMRISWVRLIYSITGRKATFKSLSRRKALLLRSRNSTNNNTNYWTLSKSYCFHTKSLYRVVIIMVGAGSKKLRNSILYACSPRN